MKKQKITIFIDSGNLWQVYKSIRKLLDFSKLVSFFENKFDGKVFKVFYYVAYPGDGTRAKENIDRLHKFLVYLKKGLGFVVNKKELKVIFQRDSDGNLVYNQKTGKPQYKEKGNFDVELTIDAIRFSSAYDVAVFFSGDSDFLPLVSYLRNLKNKKCVYVFSSKNSVSSELKTGADGYFDIADFPEIHGNELRSKK